MIHNFDRLTDEACRPMKLNVRSMEFQPLSFVA